MVDEVDSEESWVNNDVKFVEVCGYKKCWVVDVVGNGEGRFEVFWGL